MNNIELMGKKAVSAGRKLAGTKGSEKNKALYKIAKTLRENMGAIIKANGLDLENGEKNGLTKALLDRLRLNE
ncbi:MAG TPA: gamma-glutamyl-phosphate reductase, partial [Clostridiales bacterium]|nr:gamma-glutamyl-phosphate reductase [Clostridiales bacterium]